MPVGGQHVELCVCGRAGGRVKDGVGPVRERNPEIAGAIRIEVSETVAHGHAVTVTIHASQRGQDIGSGVRDKRSVMVGEKCPLTFEKVQQVGHLFEIGRYVRVIADEMRVIELNIDNVLYFPVGRVQRARILSFGDAGHGGQKRADENECPVQTAAGEKGFHKEPPGLRFKLR